MFMTTQEIIDKVNNIASEWAQFKLINDRKCEEIEHKGGADPLTINHLNKINSAIDSYQSNLDQIQTAINRPGVENIKGIRNQSEIEYKQAFCQYLRKGMENELMQLNTKALSGDDDAGYSVTSNMSEQIFDQLHFLSPIRKIANVIEIASDALELIEENSDVTAVWGQCKEEEIDKGAALLTKKTIVVHDLYAQPKASQKMLDDPRIDVESWLSNKLIDVFAKKENAAFITGDGKGKPRGLLTYEDGNSNGKIEQIKTESDGNITADKLIQLFFSLKEIYAPNAKFLASRDAIQAIRCLKNPNNDQYLWQPGLIAGYPNTLLGAEILQSADMPNMTKNSLSVIFADFKHTYQVVDRQGIKILRDPYTHKPFIKFYTTKRVGGGVVNFEAIKILKLGY